MHAAKKSPYCFSMVLVQRRALVRLAAPYYEVLDDEADRS
jgi:hypothetical protein